MTAEAIANYIVVS